MYLICDLPPILVLQFFYVVPFDLCSFGVMMVLNFSCTNSMFPYMDNGINLNFL